MKKIILSLRTIATVAAPLVAVISCGQKIPQKKDTKIPQKEDTDKKKVAAKKINGKVIFEELGEVYSIGATSKDYSKFKIDTTEKIKHSVRNGPDITWYYAKQDYITSRDDLIIAFQPTMSVTSNNNNNNEAIKHSDFKSTIPKGLEIVDDKLGKIVVQFGNARNKIFTVSKAWNNLLKQSYATAKKWANDVIGGKKNKEFDISEYINNPYIKIIPHFFLHGLNIGKTKFNTYGDSKLGAADSNNFRHANVGISFKIILKAQYKK